MARRISGALLGAAPFIINRLVEYFVAAPLRIFLSQFVSKKVQRCLQGVLLGLSAVKGDSTGRLEGKKAQFTKCAISFPVWMMICRESIMANQVLRYSRRLVPTLFGSRYPSAPEFNCSSRQFGDESDRSFLKILERLTLSNGLINEKPLISDQCYFEVFGFNRTYDIDVTLLKKRFISLQKILHPDKYSSKSEAEKELSEIYSSTTNNAYQTLSDPYQRGIYLLKLHGFQIEEDEKDIHLGDDFLEEMVSLNEAVCSDDLEMVNHVKKDMQARIDKYILQISKCFKENDLNQAKQLLGKLKFYLNIINYP